MEQPLRAQFPAALDENLIRKIFSNGGEIASVPRGMGRRRHFDVERCGGESQA